MVERVDEFENGYSVVSAGCDLTSLTSIVGILLAQEGYVGILVSDVMCSYISPT